MSFAESFVSQSEVTGEEAKLLKKVKFRVKYLILE